MPSPLWYLSPLEDLEDLRKQLEGLEQAQVKDPNRGFTGNIVDDPVVKGFAQLPNIWDQFSGAMQQQTAEQSLRGLRDPASLPMMLPTPAPVSRQLIEERLGIAKEGSREALEERYELSAAEGAAKFEAAMLAIEEGRPEANGLLGEIGYDTAVMVQKMVPALAASYGTKNPLAGISMMYGQVAMEDYAGQRMLGKSPEDAFSHSQVMAAIEGGTELVPMKSFLRVFKEAGFRNVMEATLGEGLQEGLSAVMGGMYDTALAASEDPNFTVADFQTAVMDTLKQAGYETVLGATGGATIATTTAGLQKLGGSKKPQEPTDYSGNMMGAGMMPALATAEIQGPTGQNLPPFSPQTGIDAGVLTKPMRMAPTDLTGETVDIGGYQVPKEIAELTEEVQAGEETINIQTPEREALRAEITDQAINLSSPRQEYRAKIVLGGPASGKSSLVADAAAKEMGAVLADSDIVKKMIPEYNGDNAHAVHAESKQILDNVIETAMERGDNLVWPLVGANVEKIRKRVDLLKDGGYSVELEYVDLPVESAIDRSVKRYFDEGRFVNLDYVINEVGDKPRQTYEALKNEGIADTYRSWDASVPFGEQARLIEEVQGLQSGRGGLRPAGRANPQEVEGTNSEGRQIASSPEQYKRFKRLFGKSLMTDPEGRPMVLYRGRKNPISARGASSVVWLTNSPHYAGFYATGEGKTPMDYRPEEDTLVANMDPKEQELLMTQGDALREQLDVYQAEWEKFQKEFNEEYDASLIWPHNVDHQIGLYQTLLENAGPEITQEAVARTNEAIAKLEAFKKSREGHEELHDEWSNLWNRAVHGQLQGGYVEQLYAKVENPFITSNEGNVFTEDEGYFQSLRDKGYDSIIWTPDSTRFDKADVPKEMQIHKALQYGAEVVLLNPEKQQINATGYFDEHYPERLSKYQGRGVDVGAPKNQRTVLQDENGIFVVGQGKTYEDWKTMVEQVMNRDEILASAHWYGELFDVFKGVFGASYADNAMAAWLMSNTGASPSKALVDMLRSEAELRGLNTKLGGTNHKAVKAVLSGEPTGKGIGAKISDFIDSALGKDFRTVMNNIPEGGAPFVIDVHSGRDAGYVDGPLMNVLNARFGEQALQLDTPPSAAGFVPTETQYEWGRTWGNDLTQKANQDYWLFKDNWKAAEIQAVGWEAMQRYTKAGGETIQDAIRKNIRQISYEVVFSPDSKYGKQYPEIFELGLGEQIRVTKAMLGTIDQILSDMLPLHMIREYVTAGGWIRSVSGSAQAQMLATPETASLAANIIGYLLQQDGVVASRQLKSGKSIAADITSTDEAYSDPEVLRRVWQDLTTTFPKLLEMNDGMIGFMPVEQEDDLGNVRYGMRIILGNAGKRNQNFIRQDLTKAVANVIDSQGLPPVDITDSNMEVEFYGNDWKEDPSGQGYLQGIQQVSGPEGIARVQGAAATIERQIQEVLGRNLSNRQGGFVDPRVFNEGLQKIKSLYQDKIGNPVWEKVSNFAEILSPLGLLPEKDRYMRIRQGAMGELGKIQDLTDRLYKIFSTSSEADNKVLYQYFTQPKITTTYPVYQVLDRPRKGAQAKNRWKSTPQLSELTIESTSKRTQQSIKHGQWSYLVQKNPTIRKATDPRVLSQLEDKSLAKHATAAKKLLDAHGQRLVQRGLISQAQYEDMKDAYLPQVYLKYLQNELMGRLYGTKGKTSGQGYTIPRKIQRTEAEILMGEITDAPYLISRGYSVPARDMAILDMLDTLAGNQNWIYPRSTVKIRLGKERDSNGLRHYEKVEKGGRHHGIDYLFEQAKEIRSHAAKETDPVRKRYQLRTAHDFEMWANEALAEVDRSDVDINDYIRVPKGEAYGAMAGVLVRKEIYHDLFASRAFANSTGNLAEQMFGENGILAQFHSWWKGIKTKWQITTTVRNGISNHILANYVGGIPMHAMTVGYTDAEGKLHKPLILEAIKSIYAHQQKQKGKQHNLEDLKYYNIAKKYGLFSTTFTNVELMKVHETFERSLAQNSDNPLAALHRIYAKLDDFTSETYQGLEALTKLEVIRYKMDVEGMGEFDAAMAAQEALFDYSLVPQLVRYARSTPFIGSPFATFYYKAAGAMAHATLTAPWRAVPYMIAGSLMVKAAMEYFDIDDDEYEQALQARPEWMHSNGGLFLVPMRDEAGRIQFLDIGYILPWQAHLDTMAGLADIGTGLVAPDPTKGITGSVAEGGQRMLTPFGLLGSPVMTLSAAALTGVDPFRNKPVTRSQIPAEQFSDWSKFLWSTAMPNWMPATGGTTDTLYDAFSGKVSARPMSYGEPIKTQSQALAKFLGVNLYPVDLDDTRTQNILNMKREMGRIKGELAGKIKEANANGQPVQEIWDYYLLEMKAREIQLHNYMAESHVPEQMKMEPTDIDDMQRMLESLNID